MIFLGTNMPPGPVSPFPDSLKFSRAEITLADVSG